MSNYLAVPTVGACIAYLLTSRGISKIVTGAKVSFVPPDQLAGDDKNVAGVNIFLFQVEQDALYRNQDLPTRNSRGELVQRPMVPLVLSYILTFYGDSSKLEPERLMGWTVGVLQSFPTLTPPLITETIDANSFLKDSDLAQQSNLVELTLLNFPLDDMTKVWTTIYGKPYLLSIVYRAGTVLVESSEKAPAPGLPVRAVQSHTVPYGPPVIRSIRAADGSEAIYAGSQVGIAGSGFGQDPLTILFTTAEVKATPQADQVQAQLPGSLSAGINRVYVRRDIDFGSKAVPDWRPGLPSPAAYFTLTPTITPGTVSGTSLPISVTPVVQPGQNVVLWLSPQQPGGASYSLRPPMATTPTNPLVFSIEGVASGNYNASLTVDDSVSPTGTVTIP